MISSPALPRAIPVPVAIPLHEWLPWAVFAGALMLLLVYIVGFEQSAAALTNGNAVHEWVHDSRHLLGFPCH
jgi:cobalt transporter subunit CbtB